MAKRQSFESRMLDWTDTASMTVVDTILPIMNARAKVRRLADQSGKPVQVVKRRKPRKVNAAGKATDFPTDTAVV